ncbi:hypothetical protein AMS68_004921 [Peltaster fructicola]|uniref:Major facilitator superfamily (MFS) profile domain-containing protein n=1 Tax=Peltaster fructicola TaxID=286661 RepID=A0A6H0XXE8_9PEZI|nr:hypothetical protein AMS68_004921 [Peltaster fructicola]
MAEDADKLTIELGTKDEALVRSDESGLDSDVSQSNVDIRKISKVSSILMVIVSGLALFSDGYNAQIIGYMNPLLADLYPQGFSKTIKTRLSNSYLIGEIFGMLFFGFLIDKMGRRTGIVFATLVLVLGVVLATASHGDSQLGLLWMMIVGRGIAGVGAGGEYPVCGTGSAEASDESEFVRKKRETEGVWRICFGLGFVIPLGLLFFRLRIINSTQYRKHAIKQTFPYMLVLRRYCKPMLGTAGAWFFYDWVTYPFGIFSSTIVAQFNPNGGIIEDIGYGTVVNLFYLPGCIVGGLLMDRIGRKQTMTLGFFLWAILGFILGGALGLIFNALGEMGPGVATFLCAAEVSVVLDVQSLEIDQRQSFPTPLRGHFLGFAAAMGKVGAAVGTQVFTPIQDSFSDPDQGTQAVFLIGAAFALVGGLVAWFFIPDRDGALETEDEAFRRYLFDNGFTGEFGDSLKDELKTTTYKVLSK